MAVETRAVYVCDLCYAEILVHAAKDWFHLERFASPHLDLCPYCYGTDEAEALIESTKVK